MFKKRFYYLRIKEVSGEQLGLKEEEKYINCCKRIGFPSKQGLSLAPAFTVCAKPEATAYQKETADFIIKIAFIFCGILLEKELAEINF